MAALTFASLGWTLLIDIGLLVLIVSVFNVLRIWDPVRHFYSSRRYLNIPFLYRPPHLGVNYITWWANLFKINDDDILACAGMDALTYIRFLALGLRMSLVVGIVCLICVLPVNWAAGKAITCQNEVVNGESVNVCKTENVNDLSNFDKTSLANISNKSNWLWVHLAVVYIVSFIVIRMLWISAKHAVELRVKYLASTRKGAESHTILVQNIPGFVYGTPLGRVYDFIDSPLAFLIPKKIRNKAKHAIEGGVSTVGGLAGRVGHAVAAVPVANKVQKGLSDSPDKNLDVYLGPDEKFQDAKDQFGSGSIGATPRASSSKRRMLDSASGELTPSAAKSPGKLGSDPTLPPPPNQVPEADILHKYTNLRYRHKDDRQITDFDTWKQAENAVRNGVSVEELVWREFQRTYSDYDVERVTVVKDEKDLRGLVKKYDRARTQLEDLVDNWNTQASAGRHVKQGKVLVVPAKLGEGATQKFGHVVSRVEKSEVLEWKLNHLRDKVAAAQADASRKDTSSAFVTFKRRLTQTQAANSLHYHNETYWNTEPAYSPTEIIWRNVAYRGWERNVRVVLAWTIFVLMTAFFTIPVTALQGLLQLNKIEDLPGMSFILANSFLRGIITGVLPGLALKIFLALVPTFIRWMNHLQGIHSSALIDFELGRKYYIFQYLQVFIIFILGGTIISNSKKLVDDGGGFVKSLGQTIPSAANFYISYLLVSAFITTPLRIIRLAALIIFLIRERFSGSERAKRRLWANQHISYGSDVPDHTLAVLFLLVFCVMQPFLCICALFYFATASFVARYQLLYIYRETYQSGGRFYKIIFDQVFAALVTFQVVMFAVLSVKQFPFSPILLIPIIISCIFRLIVGKTFGRPLSNLSAHAAADLDRADKGEPDVTPEEERLMQEHMDCENTPLGPPEELYVSPAFKCLDGHDELLQELADVRAKIRHVEQVRSHASQAQVHPQQPTAPADDPATKV